MQLQQFHGLGLQCRRLNANRRAAGTCLLKQVKVCHSPEAVRVRASEGVGVNPFASATPTPASAIPTTGPSLSSSDDGYGWSSHTWKWRGHTIHYKTAGCGEPLILVHGFGLSSFHYRRHIPVLAEKYKVYAIDLLGFGRSSKPILEYSMELWRDLLLDFTSEFTEGKPVVLMGNSIGALACLMTNAALPPDAVRGTVLLNTAGAMNNKGVVADWRIIAAYPLLLFIDFLLSIPALSATLFNNFRTKDNIRQVLSTGVYLNPANVDDALVNEIYAPSCDPGAREVFVRVISGPPGPKFYNLIRDVQGPLLVLWGDKDTLTPADGPVGRLLQALPGRRPDTTFKMLQDVGHCLHDDRPELVHAELLPWLERIMAGQASCSEAGAGAEVVGGTAAEQSAAVAAVVAAAAEAALTPVAAPVAADVPTPVSGAVVAAAAPVVDESGPVADPAVAEAAAPVAEPVAAEVDEAPTAVVVAVGGEDEATVADPSDTPEPVVVSAAAASQAGAAQ